MDFDWEESLFLEVFDFCTELRKAVHKFSHRPFRHSFVAGDSYWFIRQAASRCQEIHSNTRLADIYFFRDWREFAGAALNSYMVLALLDFDSQILQTLYHVELILG